MNVSYVTVEVVKDTLPEQNLSDIIAWLEGRDLKKHFFDAVKMYLRFINVLTHNLCNGQWRIFKDCRATYDLTKKPQNCSKCDIINCLERTG